MAHSRSSINVKWSPHPLCLPVPSPPGLSLPSSFQGRRWKELGDHLGGQPQALQKGSRAKHNIRLLKMWIVNTSITGQNTAATRPQPSCFTPVATPPAASGSGMAPAPPRAPGTGRVFFLSRAQGPRPNPVLRVRRPGEQLQGLSAEGTGPPTPAPAPGPERRQALRGGDRAQAPGDLP